MNERKVVITGAAGVIGRWLSEAFAKDGASLCLSDIRPEALEKLAAKLQVPEDRLILHSTDLCDDQSLQDLVDTVSNAWGAPDILINCAGIYPFGTLLETDNASWDRIMGVNVRAEFILSRDFGKAMIKHNIKGNIINIGSGAARSLRANGIPYCVSKSSAERLGKGLALELSAYGIRVNTVEPGFAPGSEITDFPPGYVDKVAAGIPLGRTSGPTDAASAVMFLCSEQASFITGATLSVDGGNSIGKRPTPEPKTP